MTVGAAHHGLPHPERSSAVGLLAVLALAWGATFPVVRWGVAASGGVFELVLADLLLAAGAMAAVAVLLRRAVWTARSFLGSMGLGCLLIGGTNLFLFWGEQFSTGGVAAIVFALTPILALLFLRALGGTARTPPQAIVALGVGLAGVFVLAYESLGTTLLTNSWGALALLLGAGCQAAGAVLVSRYRPQGESLGGQSAQFLGGAGVAAVVVLLVGPHPVPPFSEAVVGSMAYFTLVTCVAGYTLYFELLRRTGAVGANLVTYLNPVVALAIGALLLGEGVGAFELVGLLLVLVALYVFERGARGSGIRRREEHHLARAAREG